MISTTLTICLLTVCTGEPAGATPPPKPEKAPNLIERRELLRTITKGTLESEVYALMGRPDDVRGPELEGRPREGWAVGGEYQWAYGSSAAEEFAAVGLVDFDEFGRVLVVRTPDRFDRLRQPPAVVPLSETPTRAVPDTTDSPGGAPAGVRCMLGRVEGRSLSDPSVREKLQNPEPKRSEERKEKDDQILYLSFSLVNGGNEPFTTNAAPWGLALNLVVEVFNAERQVLWTYDRSSIRPIPASNPLTVPPHGRETVDVPFWEDVMHFGRPSPGIYYLRVAFPLEDGTFLYSNGVKFQVAGG